MGLSQHELPYDSTWSFVGEMGDLRQAQGAARKGANRHGQSASRCSAWDSLTTIQFSGWASSGRWSGESDMDIPWRDGLTLQPRRMMRKTPVGRDPHGRFHGPGQGRYRR